jgi:hypothetical protein
LDALFLTIFATCDEWDQRVDNLLNCSSAV